MEKFAESCKISQEFGVSRQILDQTSVQLCENLHCLKHILISFHIFYFMKKSCLVLMLSHFKVYSVWISSKNS